VEETAQPGTGARNWNWWRKVSGPRGRDVAVVSLSATYTVITALLLWHSGHPASAAVEFGTGATGTAALLWRRRYPLVVTCIGVVVFILTANPFPAGFGLMRLAITARDRVLVLATVVVAVTFAIPTVGSSDHFGPTTLLGGLLGALFFTMWGAYIGARRDLIHSLQDRAERAEQERELKADQARLAERSRIATEMHDVLAHKVSLIALQAGGLEVNADAGPDVVKPTAALIRTTARQALDELRAVLGVLRSDQTGEADLAPQPDLADLQRLVEQSRAAGVRVSLEVDVHPEPPPQLGRTVYRVVQEALTNVHKHARGAATAIVVRRSDDRLLVSVINCRPVGAASLLPGSGSGLVGLRERLAMFGGLLESGSTPDGGWSVTAVLPITGVQSVGKQLLTGVEQP
jgi:signal transduction histidine kinase